MLSSAQGAMNAKTGAVKEAVSVQADAMKRRIIEESALASEHVKEGALRARDRAAAAAENAARELVAGLQKLDSEIANHYLGGMKYGMAGSDGSRWSNYTRHTLNHHEACSVCFADKRNPFSKINRAFSFWNKAGLAFLLAIAFAAFTDPQTFTEELVESAVIACILSPYGLILDALGRCSCCHKNNVCVGTAHFFGSCTLTFFFVLSLLNIMGGIVILFCHDGGTCSVSQAASMGHFLSAFFLSLVFDQILPLVTGSFNWCFYSWEGCLCCPVCRCQCPSTLKCFLCFLCQAPVEEVDNAVRRATNANGAGENPHILCICPTKYSCCPLLTFFPIRKLLNLYQLAENTFDDDKQLFQELYPGRVAIDNVDVMDAVASNDAQQMVDVDDTLVFVTNPISNV